MIYMKTKLILASVIATFITIGISSCKDKFDDSKEADQRKLEALFTEIKNISEQPRCENPQDWKFRAIGSKACGGPSGYIAYFKNIDTNEFIKKVERYTVNQHAFNEKWNITSDCSVVNPPKKVVCENDKPKLLYNSESL